MFLITNNLKLIMSTAYKSISNTYEYYLFINAGFQGLLKLKKLRVLDVGSNDLRTIPILSALPSLKVLNLDFNNINSSQLQGLCILTPIKSCGISSIC